MRRMFAAPGAVIILLTALPIGPVAAGAPADVEAGIFTDFVAPDAGTMTPGSITFGFTGSAEVIAADAELVPPTDTNLAFLVGGAPTCLEVTRAGGAITRLAFVESCTVSGPVTLVADVFGPGADGYVTSDRIVTPEAVVLGDPGINALMKTTADSGGVLSVTFQIDVLFGAPTEFSASTSFAGPVEILDSGDIQVGAALLLSAVVDPASRALLEQAAEEGREASVGVEGEGLIDTSGKSQPAVTIVLSVTLAAPEPSPSEPPPAVLPDTAMPMGTPISPPLAILVASLAAMGAMIGAGRAVRRPSGDVDG